MDGLSKSNSLHLWLADNGQELALLAIGLIVLSLIGVAIVINY